MKRFFSQLMVLFVFAAGSVNADDDAVPFSAELDVCVAAVNARLDLSNAHRVRHTVTKEKRTGIGYALSINTAVYAADSQRRYSAYCVARGNADPVKFSFSEAE